MSASTLTLTGLVFLCLGLILGLSGWGLALVLGIPKDGGFEDRKDELTVRITYRFILSAGFCLGIGVVAIFAAIIWWGFSQVLADLTPGSLALVSIVAGPLPLLLSAIASGIASILGGNVDASGSRNCTLLGIDIGPLLHSLFMTYWLVFLTAGLAFIGLFASGIWALFRL